MSRSNPFRWSTKISDDETETVNYGARFYNPSCGRWINRDPSAEKGGNNLYAFVNNRTTSAIDTDGKVSQEVQAAALAAFLTGAEVAAEQNVDGNYPEAVET